MTSPEERPSAECKSSRVSHPTPLISKGGVLGGTKQLKENNAHSEKVSRAVSREINYKDRKKCSQKEERWEGWNKKRITHNQNGKHNLLLVRTKVHQCD